MRRQFRLIIWFRQTVVNIVSNLNLNRAWISFFLINKKLIKCGPFKALKEKRKSDAKVPIQLKISFRSIRKRRNNTNTENNERIPVLLLRRNIPKFFLKM